MVCYATVHIHARISYMYMTLIGVHKIHHQVHHVHVTDLFVCDPLLSGYSMIVYTHPIVYYHICENSGL